MAGIGGIPRVTLTVATFGYVTALLRMPYGVSMMCVWSIDMRLTISSGDMSAVNLVSKLLEDLVSDWLIAAWGGEAVGWWGGGAVRR